MLVLVALGDVGPNQVGRALLDLERAAQEPAPPAPAARYRRDRPTAAPGPSAVTVEGVDNLLGAGRALLPAAAGEPIVGYLTRARG